MAATLPDHQFDAASAGIDPTINKAGIPVAGVTVAVTNASPSICADVLVGPNIPRMT
jgi:hypothetical protein